MRLEDPYAIRRNPRITDHRFYNKWQVDIYNSVYQTYKEPGVIMHHTIELDKMKKDLKYFGEALAMCEEFDIVKLMTINKPFDPELIKQFYTTVHFGTDEYFSFSWLTNGERLASDFNRFSAVLGYPREGIPGAGDTNGWRCHDASEAVDKKELKGMYIKGWEVVGKLNHLLPTWDIMLRIFHETINPKGGNFDEIHLYEVDLLVNARNMQGKASS